MDGPVSGAGRAGDASPGPGPEDGADYGGHAGAEPDMGMGGGYPGEAVGYGTGGGGRGRGAGEESDSDEDLDEEALRIREGLADAPQMQKVQQVLHQQVERRRDRVLADLREKKEDAERLRKEREDTGVELYGVQQQLAKLQGELDAAQKSADAIQRVRTKVEADREEFRKGIRLRRQQLQEQEAKLREFASKLEGIHDTLRQASKLNEEVEAEVALKRRTAYKAEEEAGKAEKEKSEQDDLIDVLNGRIQRLGEQVALYDGQIRAQKEETAAAEATLLEATKEMETVSREKSRLLQEWKSTVLEQQRRDEALGETLKAIREQEEAYQSLDAEEGNCRKRIREAQAEHAKLSSVLEREQSQIQYCIQALEDAARKLEGVQQRQELLGGSLDSADAEVDRLVKESEGLRRQLREAEGRRDLVERRIRDADAGIEEDENAQVTARKAARNLSRDARKIMELVRQKEQELAGIENEMERIQLDKLHRAAHAEGLKVELQKAEEEVKEKEALAARYQMEIRQRNDAIEKKMATMDRLNRRYEKLVAALPEEEHMGPLHAAIHNTGKQIAQIRQESEELQKRWLQEQTSMVSAAADIEDQTAKERELKTQRMLLDRKRIRLEKEVEAQRREAAELRAGIERMREDMTRISELVSRNEELSKKLREGAFASESDFTEELKEAEKEFVEAERKVAQVKEARAELLEDTLECERQAAALEKKIVLEKELQAALDPSVGQNEIAQMQKEIHRMKLRLEELQREQRKLLHEIERAVSKREDIATKFAAAGSGGKKRSGKASGAKIGIGGTAGGGMRLGGGAGGASQRLTGGHGVRLTLGEAKKVAKGKKKEAKSKKRELQGYRAAVGEKEEEKAKEEAEAARRMGVVEGLEKSCDERQADVNSLLYDRQREVERAEAMQAMAAALRAAADGTRAPLGESEEDIEAVERAVDEAEAEVEEVRALVQEVQAAHPDMGGLLDRVQQLLEIIA